jgi:hypothetical protein
VQVEVTDRAGLGGEVGVGGPVEPAPDPVRFEIEFLEDPADLGRGDPDGGGQMCLQPPPLGGAEDHDMPTCWPAHVSPHPEARDVPGEQVDENR